jgi:hypothetical protein
MLIVKAILSKKKKAGGITIPEQIILQSNINKKSMVLPQKTDMKSSGTE